MVDDVSKILPQLDPPPDGSPFTLFEVRNVILPHPFMITPGHVALASDHYGGMLGTACLSDPRCPPCGMRDCQLSADEHETMTTAFILLDKRPGDLNDVPGLGEYLTSIKERAESLGVDGFAFPHRKDS